MRIYARPTVVAELQAENERLRAELAEAKRGYHYYSMCQSEHEQIGWHPNDWEECPVCRMRNERDDALDELAEAQAMLTEAVYLLDSPVRIHLRMKWEDDRRVKEGTA